MSRTTIAGIIVAVCALYAVACGGEPDTVVDDQGNVLAVHHGDQPRPPQSAPSASSTSASTDGVGKKTQGLWSLSLECVGWTSSGCEVCYWCYFGGTICEDPWCWDH